MLLSKKTSIRISDAYANIIGHMCYAAYKLWNVCNYERVHYRELGLESYPDWYYQKSAHKADLWFKSLPSQTAQEVCKLLDKSWKSFYALVKTGGIINPQPPRYKHEGIAVTYMQNGLVHQKDSEEVRLSLPKQLKGYMKETYDIHENYLFLKNSIFRDMDNIRQLRVYPPKQGRCEIIAVYEIEDVIRLEDNGRYLSIDLGLHNLLTCYDNIGQTMIMGRQYLSLCRKYDKEISRVQSQWAGMQAAKGVRYPKPSKHVLRLYEKKRNVIHDYLHKITRYIAEYCHSEDVRTVVIGDIAGIREGKDLGERVNQQLHGLPYARIYNMLEYKLALYGITVVRQEESWSSQCSPYTPEVSEKYAKRSNRRQRGLYVDGGSVINADAVGAYNILRKYCAVSGKKIDMPVTGLLRVQTVKQHSPGAAYVQRASAVKM